MHRVALYRESNAEPLDTISQMLCYKGGAFLLSTILLLDGLKGVVIDAPSHCDEAQSKLRTYQRHTEFCVPLGDPRDTQQRQSHYIDHMTSTKGLSLNMRL